MASCRPVLVAFVLSAVVAACSGGAQAPTAPERPSPIQPPEAFVGKPLATVNGFPVGTIAFDALAQRRTPADGKAFTDAEKAEILDQAITEELLFQEAFARGLYHDVKVKKILINQILRTEIYDNVRNEDFTDDALKAWYDAHKTDFDVPEKVQLMRIFLATTPDRDEAATKALGEQLVAKIKANPEAFKELAAEHSSDPFARRGGDVGYVGREGKPGVPAEIVARAFDMANGEVVGPLAGNGGFDILMVSNRREKVERTFEQMRGSVLRRAKNERFEELSKAFVEKLKGGGSVSIDAAALAGYNPAPAARPGLPEGLGEMVGPNGLRATPRPMPGPGGEGAPEGGEQPDVDPMKAEMEAEENGQ